MHARSVTLNSTRPERRLDGMKSHRKSAIHLGASLAIALVIVGVLTSNSRSGATDPVLAVGRLFVQPVGDAAIADLTGTFAFDDTLQVAFPLNLVVYQGTTFVRLPIGGQVKVGDYPGLADGLSVAEITALEAAGLPSGDSEILRVEPNRLQASLPDIFVDGIITALVYVELPDEGGFTSNSVSVPVVGLGGGGP
jgi:hypothetical protein